MDKENVLPISVELYCDMMGKSVDEYTPKYIEKWTLTNSLEGSIADALVNEAPEGTEAIVGFQFQKLVKKGNNRLYISGIALTPK